MFNNTEKKSLNIILSTPLLMKLLEWAKEDAINDVSLHNALEKILAFTDGTNPLTMDVYELIISEANDGQEPEEVEPEAEEIIVADDCDNCCTPDINLELSSEMNKVYDSYKNGEISEEDCINQFKQAYKQYFDNNYVDYDNDEYVCQVCGKPCTKEEYYDDECCCETDCCQKEVEAKPVTNCFIKVNNYKCVPNEYNRGSLVTTEDELTKQMINNLADTTEKGVKAISFAYTKDEPECCKQLSPEIEAEIAEIVNANRCF